MIAAIAVAVLFLACLAYVVYAALTAPVGDEIPGVGFVRRK